jgi:hypothetical protein
MAFLQGDVAGSGHAALVVALEHLGLILGYIRLSRCSTAKSLYTTFPIIFSSCFPTATIGCILARTAATWKMQLQPLNLG